MVSSRLLLILALLASFGVFALVACSQLFTVCTDEARPALSVRVVDARTSDPPSVESVVSARDGEFTSTARLPPDSFGDAALAFERPGTYRVQAEAEGFRTWDTAGVVVSETRDGCHVETVVLLAVLQAIEG